MLSKFSIGTGIIDKLSAARTVRRKSFYAVVVLGLLLVLVLATVRFNIRGHLEGLFLLKGETGSLLEVKDDLYLNDGLRLIAEVRDNVVTVLTNLGLTIPTKIAAAASTQALRAAGYATETRFAGGRIDADQEFHEPPLLGTFELGGVGRVVEIERIGRRRGPCPDRRTDRHGFSGSHRAAIRGLHHEAVVGLVGMEGS